MTRLRSIPPHPFLLGGYWVLYLLSENVSTASLHEAFRPVLLTLAAVIVALAAATLVFRDTRKAAIVVSAAVIGFFAFGRLVEAVGPRIPLKVHFAGWLVFGLAAALLAWRVRERLPAITSGLNRFSFVLFLLPVVAIAGQLLTAPSVAQSSTGGVTPVAGVVPTASGPGTTRDIYYLVFDRYGSDRALNLRYGLEDNDLPEWLAERGFQIASDSRASYIKTELSLAAALNMTHLDDLVRRAGVENSDRRPIYQMLQGHIVAQFLKARGYSYVHLGSWFPGTKTNAYADVNPIFSDETDFEAALYDTTALPEVLRRLGAAGHRSRLQHYDAARYQFRVFPELRGMPGPKFVFAHVILPHPPFVFHADGRYVTDQEAVRIPEPARFAGQLAYTNAQIKAMIEPLLTGPEETRPIVIVQADEGPFPLRFERDEVRFDWNDATTEELETKYSILSAFYLPGGGPTGVYPSITHVNTFRVVFNRYFGTNLPLLPDRSFTSRTKHRPYAMTDITERLPGP